MLTSVVIPAMIRTQTQNGQPQMEWNSEPPITTFTMDQPMQAAMLKRAVSFAPSHPNEYRAMTICRSPVNGPQEQKSATGMMPIAFQSTTASRLSHRPRPNAGIARAPVVTDERTKLTVNQRIPV